MWIKDTKEKSHSEESYNDCCLEAQVIEPVFEFLLSVDNDFFKSDHHLVEVDENLVEEAQQY